MGIGHSGTNTYGVAKWIVSANASQGTHTTIQAGVTAASAGDTVFIRDYVGTEIINLKNGVNIACLSSIGGASVAGNNNVIITGGFTDNGSAVSCSISGIACTTNGGFVISSSAASTIECSNCFFTASNFIPLNSSGTGKISCIDCTFNFTASLGLYTITAGGIINLTDCNVLGSPIAAPTCSNGQFQMNYCSCTAPLACSGTGTLNIAYNVVSPTNTIAITTSGTGNSFCRFSVLSSGTASCISVGAGSTVTAFDNTINSSNANVITGTGTIAYGGLLFVNGSTINTTTQTPMPLTVQQGGTADSSFTVYAPVCGGTTITGGLQSASTGIATAGSVLTSNGNAALPSFQPVGASGAVSIVNIQTFTSSGTYTPTANMVYCQVECVGGGGGGGGTVAAPNVGAGGGGGGYGRSVFSSATIGASQVVTIGAAGTAGAGGTGGTGGTTSLGALISAAGGVGGQAAGAGFSWVPGGIGGAGGGTFPIGGSSGGYGINNNVIGGYGGSSIYGGSTNPNATATGGAAAGRAGLTFGGGGSGGLAAAGGAGAKGVIIITEYIS